MDDFEKELQTEFLAEAKELLIDAEESFLGLEENPHDIELINKIFRLAHNLKGTSMAVGLNSIGDLTHIAENLILKIKEGEISISDNIVSMLLLFNDRVNMMIEKLQSNLDSSFDNSEMVNRFTELIEGNGQSNKVEENLVSTKVATENDEDTFHDLAEAGLIDEVEATLRQEEFNNEESNNDHEENKNVPKSTLETLRVSADKINKINEIVGELVILQTVLDQRRFVHIQDELSNKSISQLGKISKEIQEFSMSLRMVPIKSTFQKLNRIVRDTSKALDKKVNLEILGEDTEVDKTIVEYIADPLVHIVRNAVDHGLENQSERSQTDKNPVGNITVRAKRNGQNIIIEIIDDGKGINPEVIKNKAIEKGLLPASTIVSDEEIIQYIFHPGFSTKDQVTEVSGRGVGMDVVKTNIESLAGEICLTSEVGKGSKFLITLPLTMAIIEGIVIRCGDDRYIIPIEQAYEFVQPTHRDIQEITGVGQYIKLRGELIPFFNLGKTLKRKMDKDRSTIDRICIIARSQYYNFAIEVDDIINQQQIVVKPIGDEIENQKGFIGLSILGDGSPSFILDVFDLYEDKLEDYKLDFSSQSLGSLS